jgi:pyridoxine 5-phosphate synthase
MVRLSVNVNKIATLRNARGHDVPNLSKVVQDCEHFGAQGITVHPRPDERHIKYQDVFDLNSIVNTELNVEGYPNKSFIDLVLTVKPTQVTLVPDPPGVLTSSAGWDTIAQQGLLSEAVSEFKKNGIRTSIFIETDLRLFEPAKKTGADRIELYTEPYADSYIKDKSYAIKCFIEAAVEAQKVGLGVNAGHDLSLVNLKYFVENIPGLLEVSIGHALISDALYLGLDNTIKMYLRLLNRA